MVLSAHTIKSAKSSKRTAKRLGRGNGSQKGTYSGRGLKGQRSRSGGKSGTKRRGMKQSLQKISKVRGFKSIRPKAQTVTLKTLNHIAEDGQLVNPAFLKKNQVIGNTRLPIKIVATGLLEKKVTIKGCLASKKAIELIEQAGGTMEF